jgi:hypothetical protein
MRARVELTPSERKMMRTLTAEEREVVIEQMLETVREELEWVLVVDRAHVAAAAAPALAARADKPLPATHERTAPGRYRWPTTPPLPRAR